jgi:hypothetical protein
MQKKRIASDNINKIFVDYLHNRKDSYWYFSYMPTMVCLLEDIFFTFGLVFQAHTLPNFNVCFNIHRLAFILDNSKETRELCTDYDR